MHFEPLSRKRDFSLLRTRGHLLKGRAFRCVVRVCHQISAAHPTTLKEAPPPLLQPSSHTATEPTFQLIEFEGKSDELKKELRKERDRVQQSSPPPTPKACLKVGFIISKKISKKAVVRNHLRRRLKHALHETLTQTPLKTSLHLLVLPSRSTLEKDFNTLRAQFEHAFQQTAKHLQATKRLQTTKHLHRL